VTIYLFGDYAMSYKYKELKIIWTGHSGFKITDDIIIWIDPYQVSKPTRADIVLVTHNHFDHFSKADLKKILSDDSTLVASHEVSPEAGDLPGEKIYVKPGDVVEVKGVKIWAVPAYNVNKFRSPGVVFHPKEDLKVGYVIEYKDVKIYHAGDTDKIPEMRGIECDIALLPVSGTYVMTAEEAIEAAKIINPKIAIPMHYGAFVGSRSDAEKFKKELENIGINVVILERE